jgi:hypothetical protein
MPKVKNIRFTGLQVLKAIFAPEDPLTAGSFTRHYQAARGIGG